jgi:hypothetical protein
MNKYQPVSFRTVNDFLEYLPEDEMKVVEYLREIVLDCIPECTEKLSYNVPYYSRHSRICFIWPPSVPWGNTLIKGVQLGFCNGHLIDDEIGYLDRGTRKQVFWKEFNKTEDIDLYLLKSYLYDAVKIDELLKRSKKKA